MLWAWQKEEGEWWRGNGEVWGSHMFTQNTAKGYRLPISINSPGLANLDASGGLGAALSLC